MRRTLFLALSTLTICFGLVAGAQATIVTVGSPMIGVFNSVSVNGPAATFINPKVGGNSTSPITGAIVGWNLDGFSGGPFFLRVLNPTATAGEYKAEGKSEGVVPLTIGIEHFTASLPINTGQTIGLDNTNSTDHVGLGTTSASGPAFYRFIVPPMSEGATAMSTQGGAFEIGFNAEVQPAPEISAIGTTEGPASGGTSVLIAGKNFEDTTSVKFGTVEATFKQETEGAIVATSPSGAGGSSVPIRVTTRAGTATSNQLFAYQAPSAPPAGPNPIPTAPAYCVVPKLAGKKLKVAKSELKGADCKLGKVTKRKAAKGKIGRVVLQGAKAGATLPAGAAVTVTLGKAS